MRKSKNFDLNLYEGTDIFNPLTNDVPNYEKIDAQMEKNYNLSVGKATELKTGTVHALTRENADCPMIHFTATSNFTSNDTFTVDGVQVSALLVDGSTLPSNCYIIGSEVICYLKGTLLTFFLSGSVSKDSEKLGGELPSYYAKSSDVAELQETVTSSSELINKNTDDINLLKTKVGLKVEYKEFSAQSDTYGKILLPFSSLPDNVKGISIVGLNFEKNHPQIEFSNPYKYKENENYFWVFVARDDYTSEIITNTNLKFGIMIFI